MAGRAVSVPGAIASVYGDIWRETEREMAKAMATAEKNAARAKAAADARWDAPSNAPSIPSSNALSKDPNPNPNPNPKALSESESEKTLPTAPRRALADEASFGSFWTSYPRREGKKKALAAWKKLPADLVPAIMAGLDRWKASRQWHEGVVPHGTTWLNGERWNDEPMVAPPKEPTTRDEKTAQAIANLRRKYGGEDGGDDGGVVDLGADLIPLPRRLG